MRPEESELWISQLRADKIKQMKRTHRPFTYFLKVCLLWQHVSNDQTPVSRAELVQPLISPFRCLVWASHPSNPFSSLDLWL